MHDAFEITYAVHTAVCTFLLDAEGVCRRIVLASSSAHSVQARARDAARAAAQCVGAQFVACLDASVSGLMAATPHVGGAMLFARVDERGRISLVRTGVITRFDTLAAEDPFDGGARAPSVSVETSAPPLPPFEPPRRDPAGDPYGDDLDRTQLIRSLPATAALGMHHEAGDPSLDRTTEWSPHVARRLREAARDDAHPPATLLPPVSLPPAAAEPFGKRSRGILPRPSEPVRARASRLARGVEPPPPYGRAGGRRR